MSVVRTYLCNDCGTQFDHWHNSGDEDFPACPGCVALATAAPRKRGRPRGSKSNVNWVPQRVNMTGDKSRALDLAYQIAEQDYGVTNMKDSLRTGDSAAMMPVPSTAEREREEKARVEVAQYMADQAKAVGAPVADNPATNPAILAQRNAFFGGGANQNPNSNWKAPSPEEAAKLAIQSNPSGITKAQVGSTSMESMTQAMKAKYQGKRLPFDAKIIAKG